MSSIPITIIIGFEFFVLPLFVKVPVLVVIIMGYVSFHQVVFWLRFYCIMEKKITKNQGDLLSLL